MDRSEKSGPVRVQVVPVRTGIFSDWHRDVHACIGEFMGTVLFLLFALGAVQNVNYVLELNGMDGSAARIIGNYYVSAAFGLSLFAVAAIFYRYTGSIFNPSVSLALLLAGALKPLRFVLVCASQMVGGIVAAAIVDSLTPGPLMVSATLAPGVSRARGLFIEMFTMAALTLSVLMLAAEKHSFTPLAPLGFGIILMVVMLFSVQFTGGAVNTARAFGPACIEGFTDYQWIYWLGPTLGSLLATGMYRLLKHYRYWEVNPGQDSTVDPCTSSAV